MSGPGERQLIGAVLTSMVRTTATEVLDTEAAALADEPDGVHQHRVRVRRLRSVLAGMRPMLDPAAVDRLRVAYGDWGRELGTVRDIEVLAASAAAALEAHGIDDPAMWRRLVRDRQDEYATLHARIVARSRLGMARGRRQMLETFAARPAITEADAPAREVLSGVLREEARRVRRTARRAGRTAEGLHAVRKAGRRMRYVAEAVRAASPGLFGAAVDELASAGDEIHDALGAHRDAQAFARRLGRVRTLAARAGEPVAGYDALIADALAVGDERLSSLEGTLARVRSAAKRLP